MRLPADLDGVERPDPARRGEHGDAPAHRPLGPPRAHPRPGRRGAPALRDVRRDDRAGRARSRAASSRSCRCSTSTVERNAFGRQLESFEADAQRARPRRHARSTPSSSGRPIIERVGPDVDVLARLDDGRIVAVRQRNVVATAFHPELAGETRFHRLLATMAAEYADPAEGSGRRPHPTRRAQRSSRRAPRRAPAAQHRQGPPGPPDRPRRARRAVAAVPRSDGADDALARPAGQRAADRRVQPLPAAARRLPAERPAVRLRGARPSRRPRPRRARERPRRVDDRGARRGRRWRLRATSATGWSSSCCVRAAKRGRPRFHVACADADGNVELFMQAGFARYGEERILFRAPDQAASPAAVADDRGARPAASGPSASLDALALHRLYQRSDAAPGRAPRGRSGSPTGSGRAPHWRVPRSQPDADPALRRRRGVRPGRRPTAAATGPQLAALPPGRRREGGPAALPAGHRPARGTTSTACPTSASGVIAARTSRAWRPRATIAASSPRSGPTNRRSTAASRRPASRSIAERHPAHEGDARPRRRTGPRAGRRR